MMRKKCHKKYLKHSLGKIIEKKSKIWPPKSLKGKKSFPKKTIKLQKICKNSHKTTNNLCHISKGISSNKTAIVFLRPHLYSILYYRFLTYFYMVMVWKSQERDSHKWCLNCNCRVGGSGCVAAHPILCTFASRNPSFGKKRVGFLYSFADRKSVV